MSVAKISNLAVGGGIDESLFPNTMTIYATSARNGGNGHNCYLSFTVPTYGVYKTARVSANSSIVFDHYIKAHKSDGSVVTTTVSNGTVVDISDALYIDFYLVQSQSSSSITINSTVTLSK
jgi:hypothetical protein